MSTLHDVVREANVSVAQASRALRGLAGVSTDVSVRVAAAARLVGYRPNRLAQSLVVGRTQAIGVLLPTPHGNTYFLGVIEAIHQCARELGYDALISFTPSSGPEAFDVALQTLEARQVDGFLVYSLGEEFEAYQQVQGSVALPAIHLSAEPGSSARVVTVNEVAGAYEACRHLTGLGHRKIACICPEDHEPPWELREHGYERAMAEVGEEPIYFGRSPGPPRDAAAACLQMLEQRPDVTAVFARNDCVALGVLSALNGAGVRVPEDISLVGFDNVPDAEFWSPGLTTVDARVRDVVSEGLRQLIGLMLGAEDNGKPLRTFLEPRLVIRNSTQPASVVPHLGGVGVDELVS